MASAGKNQVKGVKVRGALYHRQITTVRGAWKIGDQIRGDELMNRFPNLFPKNGSGNVGWFFEQARRKNHLDGANRLLPGANLEKDSRSERIPSPQQEQGREIRPEEYEGLVRLFYTERTNAFQRWEDFGPSDLVKNHPTFLGCEPGSVGQFLRWFFERGKKKPEVKKQGNGKWKVTEDGLVAQRAWRTAPPPSPPALPVIVRPTATDTEEKVVVPTTLVGFFGQEANAVPALKVLLRLAGEDGWVPARDLARGIRKEFGWPADRPAGHNLGRALQGWGKNYQELESLGSGTYGNLRYRIKVQGCELIEVDPPAWATRYVVEDDTEKETTEKVVPTSVHQDKSVTPPSESEEPLPAVAAPVDSPRPLRRGQFVRREVYDRAMGQLTVARDTLQRLEQRVQEFPSELQRIIEVALQHQREVYEQQLEAERVRHMAQVSALNEQLADVQQRLGKLESLDADLGELEARVNHLTNN